MMKKHKNQVGDKEVCYVEWQRLPFQEKIDIVNHYWSPYNEEMGLVTREQIIDALSKKLRMKDIIDIRFKWYGWYNIAIFVKVVKNAKIRLPRKFDIFEIKKET